MDYDNDVETMEALNDMFPDWFHAEHTEKGLLVFCDSTLIYIPMEEME